MKSFLQKLAVLGSLLSLLTAGASAQVLYDANSFEATGSPMFHLGSIVPQDGWMELSSGIDGVNNPIVASTLLGALTVVPRTGTQMHRSMSSTIGYNHFVWKDLGAAYAARTPGNNSVVISLDIFLPSFYASSDHEHGIQCYDASGATFLGGFTVLNQTRSFLLYGGGTIGVEGGHGEDDVINRDEWTHITTVLDYDNNLVETYINGVQFVFTLESDGLFHSGWPLAETPQQQVAFNDADLASFPTEQTTSSSLFTDNYRVEAVRSLSFDGLIELADVPNFEDALSPVLVDYELRDSAGNSRTGQLATRQLESDQGNPARGRYSVRFHDVPNGSYRLFIKGARHLSRVVHVTVSGPGTVTVPTVSLLGGDANGDDAVDVFDLDPLVQAFNTAADDDTFNADADFNYDNFVDVFDLSILITNFNEVGEGA